MPPFGCEAAVIAVNSLIKKPQPSFRTASQSNGGKPPRHRVALVSGDETYPDDQACLLAIVQADLRQMRAADLADDRQAQP